MSQLSAIKERIRTIANLRKVTRAMELVTKTKINKVRINAANARSYQEALKEVFECLSHNREPQNKKKLKTKKYIIAFLSHKGFCGGFNDKVLQMIKTSLKKDPLAPELYLIGNRNSKWTYSLRRHFNHIEAKEKDYQNELKPLIENLTKEISNSNVEISFIYNKFYSILEQKPVVQTIYPFQLTEKKCQDFLHEPDKDSIYQALSLAYLESCFEKAYWESAAGEYCSRLLAMKNANENSELILNSLDLLYNKTRQGKITQELSEIVSAFDVLALIKEKKEKAEA